MVSDKILLAAGGTGGHMFLAGALAEQLKKAGYDVHLATDKRGMAYVSNLTPMELHQLPAATVYGGGLLALPLRMFTLLLSLAGFTHSHYSLASESHYRLWRLSVIRPNNCRNFTSLRFGA